MRTRHTTVIVVASLCVLATWWSATRSAFAQAPPIACSRLVSGSEVDDLPVTSYAWAWEQINQMGFVELTGGPGGSITYRLQGLRADQLELILALLKSEPNVGFMPKECRLHAIRPIATPRP